MSRLPNPGSDDGTWGGILNDFLVQAHNADGTLKSGSVHAAQLSAANPTNGQVLGYNGTDLTWATPSGSGSVPDAATTTKGLIQLAGDLGGTAIAPTVPGLNGKESTISTGTTSQYYRGDKSWQTLDKTAVGLTNVDNTSDLNKPINTATQIALSTKANVSSLAPVATSGSYTDLTNKPTIPTVSDATTSNKGIVQLAGDLGGTATAPTLAATTNVNSIITANTTVSGAAQKANNLSDLASPSTARTNLGLGSVDNTSDATKNSATATLANKTISGSSNTFSNIPESAVTNLTNDLAAKTPALTVTSTQTSAYTASVNQLIPVDASGAAITITLPAAPADKSRVTVKKIDSTANAVTVACGGSDVLNKTGGSVAASLSLPNQAITLQYSTTGSIWYVTSDDIPLSQLDTRFAQASSVSAKVLLIANAAALPAGTPAGVVVVVQS